MTKFLDKEGNLLFAYEIKEKYYIVRHEDKFFVKSHNCYKEIEVFNLSECLNYGAYYYLKRFYNLDLSFTNISIANLKDFILVDVSCYNGLGGKLFCYNGFDYYEQKVFELKEEMENIKKVLILTDSQVREILVNHYTERLYSKSTLKSLLETGDLQKLPNLKTVSNEEIWKLFLEFNLGESLGEDNKVDEVLIECDDGVYLARAWKRCEQK